MICGHEEEHVSAFIWKSQRSFWKILINWVMFVNPWLLGTSFHDLAVAILIGNVIDVPSIILNQRYVFNRNSSGNPIMVFRNELIDYILLGYYIIWINFFILPFSMVLEQLRSNEVSFDLWPKINMVVIVAHMTHGALNNCFYYEVMCIEEFIVIVEVGFEQSHLRFLIKWIN